MKGENKMNCLTTLILTGMAVKSEGFQGGILPLSPRPGRRLTDELTPCNTDIETPTGFKKGDSFLDTVSERQRLLKSGNICNKNGTLSCAKINPFEDGAGGDGVRVCMTPAMGYLPEESTRIDTLHSEQDEMFIEFSETVKVAIYHNDHLLVEAVGDGYIAVTEEGFKELGYFYDNKRLRAKGYCDSLKVSSMGEGVKPYLGGVLFREPAWVGFNFMDRVDPLGFLKSDNLTMTSGDNNSLLTLWYITENNNETVWELPEGDGILPNATCEYNLTDINTTNQNVTKLESKPNGNSHGTSLLAIIVGSVMLLGLIRTCYTNKSKCKKTELEISSSMGLGERSTQDNYNTNDVVWV